MEGYTSSIRLRPFLTLKRWMLILCGRLVPANVNVIQEEARAFSAMMSIIYEAHGRCHFGDSSHLPTNSTVGYTIYLHAPMRIEQKKVTLLRKLVQRVLIGQCGQDPAFRSVGNHTDDEFHNRKLSSSPLLPSPYDCRGLSPT